MGLKSKPILPLVITRGNKDSVRGKMNSLPSDRDAPLIFDDKENVEKVFDKLVKESDNMDELISDSKMLVTPDPVLTPLSKQSFQELAKEKITQENPRLLGFPKLLELFVEILFYRWSGKKKKEGYIQATVNQISVGIQLTKEEADAIMLDINPL